MNFQEIKKYHTISIQSLLKQQLQSPTQNNCTIVFGKIYSESFNPQCIMMALQLLERDGQKWLKILQRFLEIQFKITFSLCYKHFKAYPALVKQITKQGQPEHHIIFQKNVQQNIDKQYLASNKVDQILIEIYLDYLDYWCKYLSHRSLFCLKNIQDRLTNNENIYKVFCQKQKIKFIRVLSDIISLHEQGHLRRLNLRNFWKSIANTIEYLRSQIQVQGIINLLFCKITDDKEQPLSQKNHQFKMDQQEQKLNALSCLHSNVKVTILRQIYMRRASRISKLLINTKIIPQKQYEIKGSKQVLLLQNSLIYNISSDDYASLVQQLILLLSKKIPNFLKNFLQQIFDKLSLQDNDEFLISDLILKMCIISKQIIQYVISSSDSINIQQIIKGLIKFSQCRSQLIQVKILKLIHCFKEVLPVQYFKNYHVTIFTILKSYFKKFQSSNQTIELQYDFTSSNYKKPYQSTSKQQLLSKQYIFDECILILEQQVQNPDQQSIQKKIRKKKFKDQKRLQDLVSQNICWISDQLLDILAIQTYSQQQVKIFQIYRNLIGKYQVIADRKTTCLIKFFANQFHKQFHRIKLSNKRAFHLQKILCIIDCLLMVSQQIYSDTYFQCEEHLVPIVSLIAQPYVCDFQDQLLKFIPLMLRKANTITFQLNNILIYTKQIFVRQNYDLSILQQIIKQLCSFSISNCIQRQWKGLIQFNINIFFQYVSHMHENQSIKLYQNKWNKSMDLMQLFIQTYEQQFTANNQFNDKFNEIFRILCQIQPSQKTLQLIMTIFHTCSKCQIQNYEKLFLLEVYQEKYTIHILHITLTNMLLRGFKENRFDFNENNNKIYEFIERFENFINWQKQHASYMRSSYNDTYPINKINPTHYKLQTINALYAQRLIDIQQSTELKNKLIDERFLIKSSPFNT